MAKLMFPVGNLLRGCTVPGRALMEPQDSILIVGPRCFKLGRLSSSALPTHRSPRGHHKVQS